MRKLLVVVLLFLVPVVGYQVWRSWIDASRADVGRSFQRREGDIEQQFLKYGDDPRHLAEWKAATQAEGH
jgi:hypothetical protein